MTRYVFIETRDPYEVKDVDWVGGVIGQLREAGNSVALFLVQNGVFVARATAESPYLSGPISSGVEVVVDRFSLQERGMQDGQLTAGIKVAAIDFVVDEMAAGAKVIWR